MYSGVPQRDVAPQTSVTYPFLLNPKSVNFM